MVSLDRLGNSQLGGNTARLPQPPRWFRRQHGDAAWMAWPDYLNVATLTECIDLMALDRFYYDVFAKASA